MSKHEGAPLTARFLALAPEPLEGDWLGVLERAGVDHKRRRRLADPRTSDHPRRRLLMVVLVVLVLTVGASSAFALREYVFHRGIVGLAPKGATPSTPTRGTLVFTFGFGHTQSDAGRFIVEVYADGRMITERIADPARGNAYKSSTGFLEQRLTPEGVELLRSEVVATGLVGHDAYFVGGPGLFYGTIHLRSADGWVDVTWGDLPYDPATPSSVATPEQASTLIRLDARLEDPAAWLPASAWEDRTIRAYVPSSYTVCVQGMRGLPLARVLALLPPRAGNFLRRQENEPSDNTNLAGTFRAWCSKLSNDEARELERIFDAAGVRGTKDVFGVGYGNGGVDPAYFGPREFSVGFFPRLPSAK